MTFVAGVVAVWVSVKLSDSVTREHLREVLAPSLFYVNEEKTSLSS